MSKAVYDTDNDGIVDNAEKVNNHTVASDVPANAVFTDTTYTAGEGIDITNNVISNTQTSAEWGNIEGILSDQTDLQEALDNINGIQTLTGTEQTPINLNTIDAGVYIIKGYIIYGTTTYNLERFYPGGKIFYISPYNTETNGHRLYIEISTSNTNTYQLISARKISRAGSNYSSGNQIYINTNDYHDSTKQDKLVSGTNIKTINNESLLGNGNITISGGGEATDVKINGTSITSNGEADIITESVYDSSTNKIATMSDLPDEVDKILYKGKPKASGSVYGTQLILPVEYSSSGGDTQRWKSICTSRSTGTSKSVMSSPVNTKLVCYYAGESTISSGNTLPEDKVYISGPVDIRYCFNVSSLTSGEPVYLRFINYGGGDSRLMLDQTQWWTQSIPKSSDNYTYMYLGEMVSSTTLMLYPEHPMFRYSNGAHENKISDVFVDNKSTYYNGNAHIPDASTSAKGVVKLSSSTSSYSEKEAATSKAIYDLANSKQDTLVSGTNIKTLFNRPIIGSGNIDVKTINGEELFGTGNIDITLPENIVTDVKVNNSSVVEFVKKIEKVHEEDDVSNSTFVIDTTGYTAGELTSGISESNSMIGFMFLDTTNPSEPALDHMEQIYYVTGSDVSGIISGMGLTPTYPDGTPYSETIDTTHIYLVCLVTDNTFNFTGIKMIGDLSTNTIYGNTYELNLSGTCLVAHDSMQDIGTPNDALWNCMKITGAGGEGIANINLKTINNTSLLGSGDISIPTNTVSSTTINSIVKLTQSEYNALATKDSNTFYIIVG